MLPVSKPYYWFAPGNWSHPQVTEITGVGDIGLQLIPHVTPLNMGEPKV